MLSLPFGAHRLPLVPCGQLIVPQSLRLVHVTWQPHALSHAMLPQALAPEHCTMQLSLLHVMFPHAPALAQITVQSMPDGHVIAAPPLPSIVQVAGVVLKLHDEHSLGQVPTPPPPTQ